MGINHLSAQATRIWKGPGGDWSTGTNWDTGTAPGNGASLIFGHNAYDAYESNNDINNLWARSITFAADAGASYLITNTHPLRVGGTITNNSDYHAEIQASFQVISGGGAIPGTPSNAGEGVLIDTGHAGITLSGNITFDNVARVLVKTGTAALTISGTYYATQSTIVDMGDLVFSGGTVDTSFTTTRRLVLGSGWSAAAPEDYASARLVLKDNSVANFSQLILRKYSGSNSFVIESGSTLVIGSASFYNAGSSYPTGNPAQNADNGLATLNIDLTGGGRFRVTNASLFGTVLGSKWVTITELVEEQKKTGFVYFDSVVEDETTIYYATRATLGKGLTEMPSGDVSTGTSTHYVITSTGNTLSTGQLTTGATGQIRGSSLTITGTGGTLKTTHASNNRMITPVILMEEGTGDYYLDVRWLPNLGTANPIGFVHQHSTNGILYFVRGMQGGTTNFNSLVKTGAGTVVVQGSASAHTDETEIQGGRFVLESTFGHTSYFRVRGSDSVLSGKGGIGGTAISGNPRYTQVQIFDGGTLEGNNHEAKALDITGSLLFLSDGNYRMSLHEDPQYDPLTVLSVTTGSSPAAALITLAGNLELELEYATGMDSDPIILMITDGSIAGFFNTVNGQSFLTGNRFFLDYGGTDYQFQIDYGYDLGGGFTAVALHAIPEPSTIALILGGAMICFLFIRRKKSVE